MNRICDIGGESTTVWEITQNLNSRNYLVIFHETNELFMEKSVGQLHTVKNWCLFLIAFFTYYFMFRILWKWKPSLHLQWFFGRSGNQSVSAVREQPPEQMSNRIFHHASLLNKKRIYSNPSTYSLYLDHSLESSC